MFDERAYISRLESADAAELFALLRRPGADEEAALRTYLGDARYRRLHDLALRRIRADCGGRRGAALPLYDPETWGDWKLPKSLLDPAKAHHEGLAGTVDAERMIYLAGCNQATPAGVDLSLGVDRREAYSATLAGDGWVSHELGQLAGVPTFFVEEEHGGLPGNKLILRTLDELLETGKTGGLPDRLPTDLEVPAGDEEASRRLQSREGKDDRDLEAYLRRSRFSRTAATAQPGYLSSDERLVEDVLTRGFLSASDFEQTSRAPAIAADKPEIEIRLVHAGIQDVHGVAGETLPVDAIAVGHYAGMRPSGATYWIDRAISEALHPSSAGKEDDDETRRREEDCVLTQLTERRILRGELGLPFLLSDPRTAPGLPAGRVIVVAGMGIPGRFGEPELMVLSRELVWTVGRLGKRHLATVLIGSGTGNLSDSEAMSGWLRGLCHALAGAAAGGQRILRLTFCEYYPDRILQIDRAIEEQ